MIVLQDKLSSLVELIQSQSDNDMDYVKLEEVTSSIIGEDEFDSLPDHIQDEIYFIDMHDIEEPSLARIRSAAEIIQTFLNGEASKP